MERPREKWNEAAAKCDAAERICRQHDKIECEQCFNATAPAHRCQAMIAVCQDCGQHYPVVADACQLQHEIHKMPVTDGTLEGKPVSVLRDTGCSTVVVRRSLIPDEKLTGLEERCILIDGTIRQTSVAKVEVETPYVSGAVRAVCMENPICDLIIGNVSGAMDPLYKSGKGFNHRIQPPLRSEDHQYGSSRT